MHTIASIVTAATLATLFLSAPAQAREADPTHEDMARTLAEQLGDPVPAKDLARQFADLAETEECEVGGYVLGRMKQKTVRMRLTDLDGLTIGQIQGNAATDDAVDGLLITGDLINNPLDLVGTVDGEMWREGDTGRPQGTLALSVTADGAQHPEDGGIIAAWVKMGPGSAVIVGGWTDCD